MRRSWPHSKPWPRQHCAKPQVTVMNAFLTPCCSDAQRLTGWLNRRRTRTASSALRLSARHAGRRDGMGPRHCGPGPDRRPGSPGKTQFGAKHVEGFSTGGRFRRVLRPSPGAGTRFSAVAGPEWSSAGAPRHPDHGLAVGLLGDACACTGVNAGASHRGRAKRSSINRYWCQRR